MTPYQLSAADLEIVLALTRDPSLAGAAERLGVDASTVFRSLRRIERGLGQPLFERGRSGHRAGDLAMQLAAQAERIEAAVEAARSASQIAPTQVGGHVRLSSTDAVLHAVVAPTLAALTREHPMLSFECRTGNELVSLTRRDTDLAVRATQRPPPHVVGRRIGPIRVAVYGSRSGPDRPLDDAAARQADWVAPDDALPEHPSVRWRQRHWPKLQPRYRVDSILTVQTCVVLGLGIGVLPLFLAEGHPALRALTPPLDEAQTDLWLLMHPESRHLRRVATVFQHLADRMQLP